MTRSSKLLLGGALVLLAAVLPAACAGPKSAALVHPERLGAMPVCTSCHDADTAPLNHDGRWGRSHGRAAERDRRACELCHQTASCADCHGSRQEIKPTDMRPGRFDPATPHRGDYLSQHRFDGRLDPASCYACHGHKGQGRCRVCHR